MSPAGQLDFVHTLAHSGRAEDRAVWIRIATDYFAHSEADDSAWVEHLRACLADAPDAERTGYASRLMTSKSRIAGLWETLASLGGDCAHSAWKYAPGLPNRMGNSDLDVPTARAVATRSDLDVGWIAAILDVDDAEASAALAANPNAPLGPERLAAMAARARLYIEDADDRRLANALLSREPVRVELASLFLEASTKGRQALLLAAQRAELARHRPGAMATLSREMIARLERCALSGESVEFAHLLARSIGASLSLAKRIVADSQGEPLAVALAAIGAPNDVCVRILTATDMQSGGSYRRLNALARLSDILNPYAARRIVAGLVETNAAHALEVMQALPESGQAPLSVAHPRHSLAGAAKTSTAPSSERPRTQPRKVNTLGAR